MHKCILVNRKELLVSVFLWVYTIEATTLYIRSDTMDNLFQAVCCLVMLLAVIKKGWGKTFRIPYVFFLYVILILTAVVADVSIKGLYGFRYSLPFLASIILLIYMNAFFAGCGKISRLFFYIPLLYGILVSIQGILIEAMNLAGIPVRIEDVFAGKYNTFVHMESHGLGIAIADGGMLFGKQMIRVSGYYIEPSKFAAFLVIPIFFSWGLYRKDRKKRYKYMCILFSICFICVFSRAGFIALTGAWIVKKIIKGHRSAHTDVQRQVTGRRDLLRLFFAAVLFLAAALALLNLMVALSGRFPEFRVLSAGITNEEGKVNLIRKETVNADDIIALMKKRPIGYGISANEFGGSNNVHTNLANAVIFWLVSGGICGIVAALCLVGYLMLHYVIPALKSDDPLVIAVAEVFVALTIHSLSYGNWISVDFLFITGLLLAVNRYKIE